MQTETIKNNAAENDAIIIISFFSIFGLGVDVDVPDGLDTFTVFRASGI